MNKPDAAIEAIALQLLAQREHTQFELCQKLKLRGYDVDTTWVVLKKLEKENWQSDERFTEMYIQVRANKGYGPLRISQELQKRGVSSELIEKKLMMSGIDWRQHLKQAYTKKFKNIKSDDFKTKAKQIRFLQYRGFDLSHIQHVFSSFF